MIDKMPNLYKNGVTLSEHCYMGFLLQTFLDIRKQQCYCLLFVKGAIFKKKDFTRQLLYHSFMITILLITVDIYFFSCW